MSETGDNKVTSLDSIRKKVEERKKEESEKFTEEELKTDLPESFITKCLNANALGDGLLFCEIHRGKFVFNKSMDAWMVFKGSHWEIDIMNEAYAAVEKVVDAYMNLSSKLWKDSSDDPESQKANQKKQESLLRRISRLRSRSGRSDCLLMAHTCENALAIRGDEIDTKPWLLPVKNGVLDLRSGRLLKGRPEDYLMKACAVEWKSIREPCPVWDKALREIFNDDNRLVNFLQRVFGCSLVGQVVEHVLIVLTGKGRNGKSMIVDTVSNVCGPVAGPIRAEMLLDQSKQSNAAGPTPDIMALRGMRIAFASETDEHVRISPARVKWLTGNDELVGRNPHDKYESYFRPSHTTFLLTNYKPHAKADDFALWERLLLIPFEVSFVKNRRPENENEKIADSSLPDKLISEYPGILAWLVRGCIAWQKKGLKPPQKVKNETAEYRRSEDLLADFVEECCDVKKGARINATDLYNSFAEWFQQNVSNRVPKQKSFGNMAIKKFEKQKVGGKVFYFGVSLKQED